MGMMNRTFQVKVVAFVDAKDHADAIYNINQRLTQTSRDKRTGDKEYLRNPKVESVEARVAKNGGTL